MYQVLPGDAQVAAFKESAIQGELLVCRECLVEGDLSGDSLDEFFVNRAAFINGAYDEDPANYNALVASQLRKLTEVGRGDEVNLWFEYELFCAANMWFCLDLLSKTSAQVYRAEPVYRTATDRWDGFGGATAADMRRCFESRIKMANEDVALGSLLWQAYKAADNERLGELSNEVSPAFPYLKELCEAAIAKETTPAVVVNQIRQDGAENFGEIFLEFRRRAGVYGYGDSQVKRLMDASA